MHSSKVTGTVSAPMHHFLELLDWTKASITPIYKTLTEGNVFFSVKQYLRTYNRSAVENLLVGRVCWGWCPPYFRLGFFKEINKNR